jgi:hypothetical protein
MGALAGDPLLNVHYMELHQEGVARLEAAYISAQ